MAICLLKKKIKKKMDPYRVCELYSVSVQFSNSHFAGCSCYGCDESCTLAFSLTLENSMIYHFESLRIVSSFPRKLLIAKYIEVLVKSE